VLRGSTHDQTRLPWCRLLQEGTLRYKGSFNQEPLYFLGLMKEYVTFDIEYLTETYEYAKQQYKDAIGDRDKDYWEGFLDGLDTMYKKQVID